MVLDVDSAKRRISLGLKQVQRNPWEQFVDEHPIGSVVEGEIRNITEFGLFIGLGPDIDGMVHMSDLSWDEPGELAIAKFEKGQMVKAKVLDVDVEKERISLGVKQLADDPAASVLERRAQGRHRHLRGHRDPVQRHRGEGRRRADRLHPPGRTGARQVRPAARPFRRRREGRRPDHQRRPRRAPPDAHDQGQGDRGGEGRRSPSSARPTAAPRSATSWVRRSAAATRCRRTADRKTADRGAGVDFSNPTCWWTGGASSAACSRGAPWRSSPRSSRRSWRSARAARRWAASTSRA